jgi:hypothetical protein
MFKRYLIRENKMKELTELLARMPYDALHDWIDYVEYMLIYTDPKTDKYARRDVRLRRRGKTAMDKLYPDGIGLQAFHLVEDSKASAINGVAIARALAAALAPQIARRGAAGSIQIKYRYVPQFHLDGTPVLDDDGNQVIKVFGPYLYLRVWATGGDQARRKSRVKSVYIGGNAEGMERLKGGYPYRLLADHFDSLYKVVNDRRIRTPALAALEDEILSCIDLSYVAPVIDYNALSELQQRIMEAAPPDDAG